MYVVQFHDHLVTLCHRFVESQRPSWSYFSISPDPSPHPSALFQHRCLCPCFTSIKYHLKDHCIYNSCFLSSSSRVNKSFHSSSRPCIATLPSTILLCSSFSHTPSNMDESATTSI